MLIDEKLGHASLHEATSSQAWVGRPIEASGEFPLALEAPGEIVQHLADWPLTQTLKVLCPYQLDDDESIRLHHDDLIMKIDRACKHTGHEWLLEIITARGGNAPKFDQVTGIMDHFYGLGVKPVWW